MYPSGLSPNANAQYKSTQYETTQCKEIFSFAAHALPRSLVINNFKTKIVSRVYRVLVILLQKCLHTNEHNYEFILTLVISLY